MIDLYYSPTPNGQKVRVLLEELGLDYRIANVSLSDGEQFRANFVALSPNSKIPVIVDDGQAMFESCAILLYLAEKTGQFISPCQEARGETIQWLFWQAAGLGPSAGQAGHFLCHANEEVPYAIERYKLETTRLYKVLDERLRGRDYIVDTYSVADIACYPWIVPHESHEQKLKNFPCLLRWFSEISDRPAVQRSYKGVSDVYSDKERNLTQRARSMLFSKGTVLGL